MSRLGCLGVLTLIAAGSGCAKDVCANTAGTCIALHLRSQTLQSIDQVSLSGTGLLDVSPIVTPTTPKRTDLPLDIAITLRQAATGNETIHAIARMNGADVGEGDQIVHVVAGKHSEADLLLSSTSATTDMSMPGDDLGPRDLQATDLIGVVLVDITSPGSDIYSHATSIPIQVAVSNAAPDSVALWLDGNLMATLNPPYSYTWDVSTTADGSHTLVARATRGSETFESNARTIVLDHVAPNIVTMTPIPGATNVTQGSPVEVTFSEPILDTTVTDASVTVMSDLAPTNVTKTLSLSADGKTLTIVPNPSRPFGATLTVTLSTNLTDAAGNALVLPSMPWKWLEEAFPVNVAVAGLDSFGGLIAIDSTNNPSVATSAGPTGDEINIDTYVLHWTGSTWQVLGSGLNPGNGCPSYPEQVIYFGAEVWLLEGEDDPNGDGCGGNTYVKRWPGSQWFDAAPKFSDATEAHIAIGGSNVYVASLSNTGGGVTVRKYVSSTQWDLVGATFLAGTATSVDNLIVDPSTNQPVVAVGINGTPLLVHLYRWSGSAWTDLGALKNVGNKNTMHSTLALDSGGKIVAGFYESPNDYVQRYTSTFASLGAALNPVAGQTQPYSILRSDASGNLRLAVSEVAGTDHSIYLYKWDGTSSWLSIGQVQSLGGMQYTPSEVDLAM